MGSRLSNTCTAYLGRYDAHDWDTEEKRELQHGRTSCPGGAVNAGVRWMKDREGGKFKLSFRRFPPPRSSCLSTSPGPLSAPEEAYRRVVDARTTLLVVRETVRSTMEYMLSGNF